MNTSHGVESVSESAARTAATRSAVARMLWGTLAISAVTAVILKLIGQPLWCTCGRWTLWSWDIWSSHNSQHLLDPYSFTHVLHGVLLCGALYWLPRTVTDWGRFLIAIILEALWEILENLPMIIERYRTTTISKDYAGDSVANSVSDILACVLGYWLAHRLRTGRSLVLFAMTELALVMTVRDSLILNILMLVWPLEVVEQWQLGK